MIFSVLEGYASGFIDAALLSTLATGLAARLECALNLYFARFAVKKQIKKCYLQKVSLIDHFLVKRHDKNYRI